VGKDSARKAMTKDFVIVNDKVDMCQLERYTERNNCVILESNRNGIKEYYLATPQDVLKLLAQKIWLTEWHWVIYNRIYGIKYI